jgi:hypothetical protein
MPRRCRRSPNCVTKYRCRLVLLLILGRSIFAPSMLTPLHLGLHRNTIVSLPVHDTYGLHSAGNGDTQLNFQKKLELNFNRLVILHLVCNTSQLEY